jgi:uncharacterized protein
MEDASKIIADEGSQPCRSLAAEYGKYVATTYIFTWTLLIYGVKHGWSEEYLSVSTAGPAITALCLARSRTCSQSGHARWIWFMGFLAFTWIVICLNSSWRSSNGSLPIHWNGFLLIPAVAPAWILSSAFSSNNGVRALGRRLLHSPDRWSMYAFLFFPVLWGIPSAVACAFGAHLIWPDAGGVTYVSAATGGMLFLNNLVFVALLEEPGWRGFLLDRLQSKFSPLAASLLVWLPWALWHGPVDYYRPVRFSLVEEILLRVVTMIPTTIILTWFYNRSRRSIQTVAIFHACMNSFPYIFAYYPAAWLAVFMFAIYAVIVDRMWSRNSPLLEAAHNENFTTNGNVRRAASSLG